MNANESLAFLLSCLPQALQEELNTLSIPSLLEIRLRANRPVQFKALSCLHQGTFVPDSGQVQRISETLSEHGLYARYDEARRGFITLRGGHRLGLCGKVQWERDEAVQLCDIASVCLRIAREHKGACKPLLPYIKALSKVPSILILGAPTTGKTTLLRDLARNFSDNGIMVGMNDERGELAACQNGVPQLDVGFSTDVLDGCQKAYGIRWLIRSMAPQLIVTDEISGMEDTAAILDAKASGIAVMASVHAGSIADIFSRTDFGLLCHQKAFDMMVQLKTDSVGSVEEVYNREGERWHLQRH